MPTEPDVPSGPDPRLTPELRRALESLSERATMRNAEQLEAASFALMQAAMEHLAANPPPDMALEEELQKRCVQGHWVEALACLRRLSAGAESRGEPHNVYRWQEQIAALHALLGDSPAARAAARRSTEAARRVENMSVLVGLALQGEAGHALAAGEYPSALELVEEALVQVGTESHGSLVRARALVIRARCRIGTGDWRGAESDLNEAGEALRPMADSLALAGAQSGLAAWHEALARLAWAQGEPQQAVAHQREAVLGRRIVAAAPQIEPHVGGAGLARALAYLAEIEESTGNSPGAEQARDERRQILAALKLPAVA